MFATGLESWRNHASLSSPSDLRHSRGYSSASALLNRLADVGRIISEKHSGAGGTFCRGLRGALCGQNLFPASAWVAFLSRHT
jgi:hypothetical protein